MRLSNFFKTLYEYFTNKKEPELSRDLALLVSITDDKQYKYSLSPNMTPELLSEVVVRIALMTDASQIVKILEGNGYKDAIYRMRHAVSTCMELLISDIVTLDVKNVTQRENGGDVSQPIDDQDRPIVEALY